MTSGVLSGCRVAVIGAGLSGLVCARELTSAGADVVVFEKSRSFGGRCASRRWRGHVVDHGAQYFTVRSERFRRSLEKVVDVGRLKVIRESVIDRESGESVAATGGERWYHEAGNNRIGRALAEGIVVRLETRIDSMVREGGRWMVGGASFDAVVVGCPFPQAAPLIGVDAAAIAYEPCLTLLFEFEGEAETMGLAARRYGLQSRGDRRPLAWSACENHKAGRVQPGRTVLVAQASASFSRARLEEPPEEAAPALLADLREAWELGAAEPSAVFAHRWRFARLADSVAAEAERWSAWFEPRRRLFLTGDGLARSRIEDVWLAGMEAAGRIRERL